MFVVDTNILLYAAHRGADEHERCRELLEELRGGSTPWFLTWGICYEFLRVATHPRVFTTPWSAPEGMRFLDALSASASFSILLPTPKHAAILSEVIEEFPDVRGNLAHDLHTAVLMREHGISRIHTRDTDFHRFPFLTVLDPFR